ncbi:hypothetical protein IWX65_003234 [Arthrobacter sp. CAN_A214]|uniref:hypothetical protein n=1 Tax=Arthrobacter sp. CAN_A214 TaxID=2787720 RepID=UPI001A308167
MNSRLTPAEPFPDDLAPLEVREVEVLNSKVLRELDYEYANDGVPAMETEFRHEELRDELDRRDDGNAAPTAALPAPNLVVVP